MGFSGQRDSMAPELLNRCKPIGWLCFRRDQEELGMECELKDITAHYELFGEGKGVILL
jgi:hypothetical protein